MENLGILKTIGAVVLLYFTWKRLKDDYKPEKLISYGWISLISFLFGSRLVFGLANWGVFNSWQDWLGVWQVPGMDYWGGYLVWLGVSYWWSQKNEWKYWPLLEDMAGIFLVFLMFWLSDELLRSGFDLKISISIAVVFISWLAEMIVRRNYRSYIWYKSGRKGFSFLFANILATLTLGIINWLVYKNSGRGFWYLLVAGMSTMALLEIGGLLESLKFYGKKKR